jgi:arsenate reductase-like glutaredoxin family protein
VTVDGLHGRDEIDAELSNFPGGIFWIERAEIEQWVAMAGLDVTLKRRCTICRALPDADEAGMTQKNVAAMMRPVREQGATLLFGFKPEAYMVAPK